MRRWLRRYVELLRGRDKGTVAITFLLSLPILLLVIGAIVQYALLVTAHLTLDRALAAAARSAMTSLPTDPVLEPVDGAANVQRTALMNLATLSPAATYTTSESQAVADALGKLGVTLAPDYAQRYAHAQDATHMTWVLISGGQGIAPNTGPYPNIAAPRIRLTITYDYRMDVPAINMLAGLLIGRNKSVGGVSGNYFTLVATQDVQLSSGREVPAPDR